MNPTANDTENKSNIENKSINATLHSRNTAIIFFYLFLIYFYLLYSLRVKLATNPLFAHQTIFLPFPICSTHRALSSLAFPLTEHSILQSLTATPSNESSHRLFATNEAQCGASLAIVAGNVLYCEAFGLASVNSRCTKIVTDCCMQKGETMDAQLFLDASHFRHFKHMDMSQ